MQFSNRTLLPSNTLELGLVVHSVGQPGASWEELYQQSLETGREVTRWIEEANLGGEW